MTLVLVLHDVGDEDGGRPWEAAFRAAGWPGDVLAPDLPGHGDAPPPPGGAYELADAAFAAVPRLAGRRDAVVVGVGANGWPAQVLGLGGRAAAVVLVDGLDGPWVSPRAAIGAGVDWLRALADDPAAVALPAGPGMDPRLRHGVPGHGDRGLAERAAAALALPVLLLESPASALAPAEVDDLAARLADGTRIDLDGPGPAPEAVAEATTTWWRARTAAFAEP